MALMTGCSKSEPPQQPWQKAKQYLQTVIDCTERKDAEGIKELFCTNVQEKRDLDGEIEEFFGFIDGNIVSYNEPDGHSGPSVIDWGETIEEGMYGEIDEIETDKGEKYRIYINGYLVNKNHKEYVGIGDMGIENADSYYDEKGHEQKDRLEIGGIIKSILPDDF